MQAIIRTGSKQYRIQPNDILEIETLPNAGKAGSEISLKEVLFVENGDQVLIGQPTVKNASILCEVLGAVRGDKIISYKFRRTEQYRRKIGHRQNFTRVKVKEIVVK